MSELWDTAMGAWSDHFADLMLPFDRLPLSRADLVFIGNGTPGFSYSVTDPCPEGFSQLFRSNLTQAMVRYPMGAHLRIDLCSFSTGEATPRVVGVNGALWLMRQANPRVSGVIRRGMQDGQAMSLFIFPWLPIPKWAEFRVVVLQGRLAGITQYHTDEVFWQIAQNEAAIKVALDTFMAAALPRIRQPDVVLDVLAEPLPQQGFRIRLVDIALIGPRTDLGLFSADRPEDMTGVFRFRRAEATAPLAAPAPAEERTLHPSVMGHAQATPPAPEDDFWRS